MVPNQELSFIKPSQRTPCTKDPPETAASSIKIKEWAFKLCIASLALILSPGAWRRGRDGLAKPGRCESHDHDLKPSIESSYMQELKKD